MVRIAVIVPQNAVDAVSEGVQFSIPRDEGRVVNPHADFLYIVFEALDEDRTLVFPLKRLRNNVTERAGVFSPGEERAQFLVG